MLLKSVIVTIQGGGELLLYKETPRERLLEFMDGAPDVEELKKLSEDELRYAYAERLTRGAIQKRKE